MKSINIIANYFCFLALSVFLFPSCDEFLDKTPEAEVTDEDVFGTYRSFQGFLDPNYHELMDYNKVYLHETNYFGGEIGYRYMSSAYSECEALKGNYWGVIGPKSSIGFYYRTGSQPYGVYSSSKSDGIWVGGWRGIRRSNEALMYLHMLKDATQEEKDLIRGQAYFFRAYFHGDIMKSFGGMPYVDTVFKAADELKLPRLSYQQCTEKIIEDLDRAIPLLPKNWDETDLGSQTLGAHTGRITRGTALAYKQKYLLYAGSPLMNGFSGNDFTYNVDYCKKAAAAGWEMIKLANEGYYSLVPMVNYYRNFHNNNDGTRAYSTETILQKMDYQFGTSYSYNYLRRKFLPVYLGGAANSVHNPNQMILDRFEMADGTRYKVEYDYENDKRWKNRDPRFHYNFYVDRDKLGTNALSVAKLYVDPANSDARPNNFCATPYIIKKFMPWNANRFDNQTSKLQISTPLMRLSQVYLDYAEAVTAAYGPTGSVPGSNMTAVDAINIIRLRAGMPAVTANAEGYKNFMELVWNERTIELIFESHYWFDIRRWYVAHLPEYKEIIDLEFDKDWTFFNRKVFLLKVFENPKHYWLPIYRDQVLIYPEFYQNPGWE